MRMLLCAAALAGASCAAQSALRPAGKGNLAVSASVGGPIIDNIKVAGVPIPLPVTVVGARYGVDDKLDVHGSLHVPVLRLFGADAGATYHFLEQDGARPHVSAGGKLYFMSDFADSRVFLEASSNASWKVAPFLFYTGLTAFVEPLPTFVFHGVVHGGAEWRPLDWFGLQLELQWISPWINQSYAVVGYQAPGGWGAIGPKIGLNFYFGGKP
jgi:hypothetical protein